MSALSTSIQFDTAMLDKLLRKESIARLVFILRIVLLVTVVLLLIWFVHLFISKNLEISNTISKLEQEVDTILTSGGPVMQGKKKKGDYNKIVEKNIFGISKDQSRTAAATPPPAKKSTVALALIGTFVTDGESSFAIIEHEKKKEQESFTVGESIFAEAKLVKIFTDHVEIDRNGTIEILTIDDTPSPSSGSGVSTGAEDNFVIDEAELDKALENLPLLLTQARAVPYFKEGKSVGLRLFAIKTGSLFEKIGLKNGDILKSINEKSLADFSQALKLFERLKEERELEVILERSKQPRTFRYSIQ